MASPCEVQGKGSCACLAVRLWGCEAVRHEIEKGPRVVQGRARVELPSPCSPFLSWVTLPFPFFHFALHFAQVDPKARVAPPFLPSRRSPLSPLLKIVPRVNWASLARWDHTKFIRIHPVGWGRADDKDEIFSRQEGSELSCCHSFPCCISHSYSKPLILI